MKYDITSMTRDNGFILAMVAYTRESDGKRMTNGYVVPAMSADMVAVTLAARLRADVNLNGTRIVDLDAGEDECEAAW